MHQTFDAGFQLHKGAVVGDVADATGKAGANRIFGIDAIPGIGLKLLHAKRNTLGFGIEADDLNLDRLANRQNLARMVDPAPGDIGDMQQTVNAAQIDKGAIIGEVLDHALDDLTFGQAGQQLGTLFGTRFFQNGTARHDDIAPTAIHLEDQEGLRRPHQRGDVANRAHIDLAAGQEGHGAGQIDRKAAFDAAKDRAGHALGVVESFFEHGPGFLAARLFARQHGFALLVFHPLKIDIDDGPDRYVGFAIGGAEFSQGNATL